MDLNSIANRVAGTFTANRGQQVQRKDKDLMSDTGGMSKGRDREPHNKPPRDDIKERYRDKRLNDDQRQENEKDDKDVKDVTKTNHRQSSVHPLDRTQQGAWAGIELPEENYHRQVYRALWGILECENQVSEKDFDGQDRIKAMCEEIIRSPEAEGFIQRCSDGQRASLCAEWIYEDAMDLTQMRK